MSFRGLIESNDLCDPDLERSRTDQLIEPRHFGPDGGRSRVGDRWSIMVVMEIASAPKRFSEVRRATSGISQKMLAATLRGLERDGFVTRTVYPIKPPSVEYALTELGQEMVVPVKALGTWVIKNVQRIESARDRYDAEREQIQR